MITPPEDLQRQIAQVDKLHASALPGQVQMNLYFSEWKFFIARMSPDQARDIATELGHAASRAEAMLG